MSFGKVEVIHETQFLNAAQVAGMSVACAEEWSQRIGLKTAANHELPAIVVIEKMKDYTLLEQKNTEDNNPLQLQKEPEEEKVTKIKSPESSAIDLKASKFDSFIDMSMIKLLPKGYMGNFLDRHLVYTIEDQNRVINLERGTRTLQVSRRFSDFAAVREYLLIKYPYRCIPRLPVKRVQMFSDDTFLMERQKSLRRFLGIISQHHMYKLDPVIQAFIYNQKEYYDLITDSKITAPDRDHMMLTQIPSADALVNSNKKEALDAIENSKADVQSLLSFVIQIRDQVKILIETATRESYSLSKLSTVLIKSENITNCLCPVKEDCQSCKENLEGRKVFSSKLGAVIATTEANTILEYEEIVEKFNLLIDLYESFGDLVNRGLLHKSDNFDEIHREIGVLEVEIEKKRMSSSSEGTEGIEHLERRINLLKQEWDEQETFSKFIQYSIYDELHWVHTHTIIMKKLLDQLSVTFTLKQRQWIAIFEA